MKRKTRSLADLERLPDTAWMTKQETADWMRVSIWVIDRLIAQKALRATKIEKQWRTCKAWIDEYTRTHTNALSVVVKGRVAS